MMKELAIKKQNRLYLHERFLFAIIALPRAHIACAMAGSLEELPGFFHWAFIIIAWKNGLLV